ncbi:MAG: TIGR03986 family CRISPR-associated RAMP protein, partial [Vicinamibacterales bacterium]
MALEKGILRVSKSGSVQIEVPTKKGGTANLSPSHGEISQSVLDRLADLAGKEVEFERVEGQPKKVREVGGSFVSPRREAREGDRDRGRAGRGGDFQPGRQQGRQDRREEMPRRQPDFHNPYNFVPAPPRNTSDPDLGDHRPVDQDAYLADRYSGCIRVRMTARTPLLVPDTENAQESANGHKTFPLRVDANGEPLIPASSVRGMLRSAYEAVTNSRFGRFSREQHGDRLAFRMDAREGLRLIPARVENGQIRLMTGTSSVSQDGSLRQGDPQYAAWLGRYWNGQLDNRATRYRNGDLPAHGDVVDCWLERFQHHRWDRGQNRHVQDFQFWKVRSIVRHGETLGAAPGPSNALQQRDGRSWHEPAGESLRQVHGWVCVTNANINRKHDERIFFQDVAGAPGPFSVTDAHRHMWRELIQNYQSIHRDDLRRRDRNGQAYDEYLGAEPGRTAWSRHVYTEADRNLTDGTLCYVRLSADQSEAEALFPVMIARELYSTAPLDLLDDSLRPAATIDQLSPADRVFGWVKVDADAGSRSRGERVAARGLLRVGPVRCESSTTDAVEQFAAPGVPLAILSTPKPQQGRFYVARSPNGEAQRDGLSKQDAGFSPGKGLRGRKVYPHQTSLPDGHWNDPTADRTQQPNGTPAHHQEYRRARKNGQEQRDDQNRSILGWVKAGAQFSFDLQVQNLSAVELGALLWLLELPADCFFRFGGGKPLGFGSVRLAIESCDLRTGGGLRGRYGAWHEETPPSDPRTNAMN